MYRIIISDPLHPPLSDGPLMPLPPPRFDNKLNAITSVLGRLKAGGGGMGAGGAGAGEGGGARLADLDDPPSRRVSRAPSVFHPELPTDWPPPPSPGILTEWPLTPSNLWSSDPSRL